MNIAIVGTGISGLSAAWLLSRRHDVDVFEKNDYPGGHSHTVSISSQSGSTAGVIPIDTGFIVYNERTYPLLTRLFRELDVVTQESDMSFSVSCDRCGIDYASSARGLFAAPGNWVRPDHWRMMVDMFRFFRDARGVLDDPVAAGQTLGEWLAGRNYGAPFRRHFLLPLGGAVWSTSLAGMTDFPVTSFVRFFENHGFLGVNTSPPWRTVTGGSREYVRRLIAPFAGRIRLGTPVRSVSRRPDAVTVVTATGKSRDYDQVILAAHADQSLALLADPSPEETRVLSGIPYTANEAVLHTDASLLPRHRGARASWNIHLDDCAERTPGITMTYDMSRLQSIPGPPFCVTLNDSQRIDQSSVIRRISYEHPFFSVPGLAAREGLGTLNGQRRTWYCGAWTRFGFHEDGLMSGIQVAGRLGVAF
ncbi:MAG: FAD-dependent oxidoreductase [Candidatus Eisenbacteria bacterium]|nr:FAD-dependent oxidoreductase [Candidatus Eisenbacteria bacterium]